MPYKPVDINQIKLDSAPPVSGGFVPVDINKIQLDDAPNAPNIIDRLGADISRRAAQAGQIQAATNAGDQTKAEEIFQLAGTGAGLMGDISGEAIRGGLSLAGQAMPRTAEHIKSAIKKVGNLPSFGGGTIGEQIPRDIQKISDAYGEFEKEHPRAARNIGAGANLALTLPGMAAVGEDVISAGGKALKGVGHLIKSPEKMTSDQMREIGGELFQRARQSGGMIGPVNSNNIIDNIKSSIVPKSQWAATIPKGDAVGKFLENIDSLRGSSMGLDDAMALDSALGDIAYANVDAFGKMSDDGAKFLSAQRALRNSIDDAASNGAVMGGNDGIRAWNEGKKIWAAHIRLRDVERIVQKGLDTQTPATSIRTGFKNLKNSKNFSSYSTAEKAAISNAAKTGVITDILSTFGSRLSPLAGMSTGASIGASMGMAGAGPIGAAMGAGAGAAVGGAAGYVTSAIGRGAARSRQLARAQRVADLIRSRITPSAVSPSIINNALLAGGELAAGASPLAAAQELRKKPND